MSLQIPAILGGFTTKVDGTASVRFSTNEISDEDFLILKQHQGKFGFLLFSENSFQEKDVPRENAENRDKTPSKRLRNVLYVGWQQKGSTGDFETYYASQMEKILDYLKTKLD